MCKENVIAHGKGESRVPTFVKELTKLIGKAPEYIEEASFCSLNYGVTFPVLEKIDVNGKEAHPLYGYLKQEQRGTLTSEIKWNFTKFLIDTQGKVIGRYAPTTPPMELEEIIKNLIA